MAAESDQGTWWRIRRSGPDMIEVSFKQDGTPLPYAFLFTVQQARIFTEAFTRVANNPDPRTELDVVLDSILAELPGTDGGE